MKCFNQGYIVLNQIILLKTFAARTIFGFGINQTFANKKTLIELNGIQNMNVHNYLPFKSFHDVKEKLLG